MVSKQQDAQNGRWDSRKLLQSAAFPAKSGAICRSVTGHDFSRAEDAAESTWASAPEGVSFAI
jgi:hypothetical protein